MPSIELKKDALVNIKMALVPEYFNTTNEFNKAKTLLLKKIEANNYENKSIQQPIDSKYFFNELVFLCSNYELLVGSVLSLGRKESAHLLPDLKNYRTDEPINWDDLRIETIANAEYLFSEAQKTVNDLLLNPSPSNQICNRILDQIKPLAGAKAYYDIRRIYWMLFCELRVTLQFQKPDPNWNFFFNIGDHPENWFNLRGENDVCVLKYINEHTWEEYQTDSGGFRSGALKAAKGDCVSEPGSKTKIIETQVEKYNPSSDELAIFKQFEKEYGIVSRSKCMLEVFELINDYKNTKSVLITGDTGTGKELISQAIHGVSSRKKELFIPLNCGGIPEHIVESELFGAKKGAYTDLTEDREGYFSASNGGTIFLDEIGEMSLGTQAKLLRVLEDGSYTRLGDPTPRNTDCKVISATNRNLLKAVKDKSFREDLYSRIEHSIIHVPSLAKRVSDIPLLSMHFLRKYADNNDFKIPQNITITSFNILMDLEWPRNIRQLRNFIEGFLNRNKDHLHAFEPWMLKRIFEDDTHTITIRKLLSQSEGKSTKIDINYPQYLITYINNGFNKVKTGEALGVKDTRSLRGKINSELLYIGDSFNFNEVIIAKHLTEQYRLQGFDQEKFLKEICSQFKEIIKYCQTPHESRPPQRAYSKECDELAIKLTKIRSDLM